MSEQSIIPNERPTSLFEASKPLYWRGRQFIKTERLLSTEKDVKEHFQQETKKAEQLCNMIGAKTTCAIELAYCWKQQHIPESWQHHFKSLKRLHLPLATERTLKEMENTEARLVEEVTLLKNGLREHSEPMEDFVRWMAAENTERVEFCSRTLQENYDLFMTSVPPALQARVLDLKKVFLEEMIHYRGYTLIILEMAAEEYSMAQVQRYIGQIEKSRQDAATPVNSEEQRRASNLQLERDMRELKKLQQQFERPLELLAGRGKKQNIPKPATSGDFFPQTTRKSTIGREKNSNLQTPQEHKPRKKKCRQKLRRRRDTPLIFETIQALQRKLVFGERDPCQFSQDNPGRSMFSPITQVETIPSQGAGFGLAEMEKFEKEQRDVVEIPKEKDLEENRAKFADSAEENIEEKEEIIPETFHDQVDIITNDIQNLGI